MPPKIKTFKCEICGNRYTRDVSKKRMFMAKFPLDEDRCRQWVKLVGKEDLAYVPIEKLHELKYICGNHFEDKAFNKKKNRLKRSAIPSKNLHADPLPDDMLVDFPSHIFSNIIKNHGPSVIQYKGVSQSHVEAIAGPCNSGTTDTGTNKTAAGSIPQLEQAEALSDHLYYKKQTLPAPVEVQPATKDGSSKLDIDLATDDPIETDADAFDNDSLPSPVPEIGETHENIFSWQKTELIEADVPEAPTPVPEKTKLPDDVVTLSLFCDDSAPIQSEPSAPVAAVTEDVEVRCKDCAADIDGFSFWCVQCLCGALCVACAASEAHYAHYVLRSPKGATQNQTQAVLAVIRKQLVMENLLTLYETGEDGVKVEVKYEPEEPPSPSPAPPPDPLAVEEPPSPSPALAVEEPPSPSPALAVEEPPCPSPALAVEEPRPRPGATVEQRVDEETNQHTVKRLRQIDPRTRIINSTVQMKRKLLKVPVGVLRRLQTDHTPNSDVLRAKDIIATTSNVRASQQKHSPNVLRKDQKVQKLTIGDLRPVKLVTSSNIRESQVLISTASNLGRSRNVPIRLRTVQTLTAGDLKSQGVVQATTSNSRVSQDNANRPMRDPSEMILRTVTSEPTVQLQPLTSADIMKWSADRKRRRND